MFLCEEIKQNVIFLFLDYYYREDNNVKKERNDMKNVVKRFEQYLMEEEKSKGTIENYIRSVHMFIKWIGVKEHISRQAVIEWKNYLQTKGYCTVTVNAKIAALNQFLSFMGRNDCRVKLLKVQHRVFRDHSKELNKNEYKKLIDTAESKAKHRLSLLIQTICATGIRVSEVKYITVAAAQAGKTEIILKGKVRTILLPGKLCRKLIQYAKKQKIASGEIFITRSGIGLSRKQIWSEMKTLCVQAGIEATKVFPHNLRHLFARCYYQVCHDIVKLADILGHSHIETTRIYLLSTGTEHQYHLERLRLVS